jgi:CRISPR-associated endonuclease Cas2
MYLVSYDITSDPLRLKVIKVLLRYGMYRVQYSVFMGVLKPVSYARMQRALAALPQHKLWLTTDTVMVLPLHQYSRDQLWFMGAQPANWPLVIENTHTLMF